MLTPMSRRSFLVLTGGVLSMPHSSWAANDLPSLLDHILLGCSDLDSGIAFVEKRLGVRAEFGGVHPGRGTRNALLSLGERRYLEIIAPDPEQASSGNANDLQGHLRTLEAPRLIGWAAHPPDIQALATRLAQARIAIEGPTAGSRKRPDGRILHWTTLTLRDNAAGLLPFFIEWSAGSLHPSSDAPAGCSLVRFEAVTLDPDALSRQIKLLGLDLPIRRAEKSQLRAILAGPKGQFSVAS
jgi:Glyoxalase-like domain